MHEASLAGSILKLVEDAALREGFRRVSSVRIEAGRLAGVEVEALRFTLGALAPGTCLEGAQFDIDEPPGLARCLDCRQSVAMEQRGDPCPCCGGFRLQPTGGTELRVVDLIVHDE
jgi:hydrogenase nickel incorporation protein HypA/HybF